MANVKKVDRPKDKLETVPHEKFDEFDNVP
jgi:hypothetical protein